MFLRKLAFPFHKLRSLLSPFHLSVSHSHWRHQHQQKERGDSSSRDLFFSVFFISLISHTIDPCQRFSGFSFHFFLPICIRASEVSVFSYSLSEFQRKTLQGDDSTYGFLRVKQSSLFSLISVDSLVLCQALRVGGESLCVYVDTEKGR